MWAAAMAATNSSLRPMPARCSIRARGVPTSGARSKPSRRPSATGSRRVNGSSSLLAGASAAPGASGRSGSSPRNARDTELRLTPVRSAT